MDEKTLTALKGSIAKWEGIVAGTEADKGANNCPLCLVFNPPKEPHFRGAACSGCPVSDETGEQYCSESPYDDILDAAAVNGIDSEEYAAAARAELKFLRSLLPETDPAATLIAEERTK